MFLTAAGFKKLITSAYKGAGLHVANDGMELAHSCNMEMEPTRVLMVSSETVRLFQNKSQPVVAASERLYSLIQPSAADPEEEGPLIGPGVKVTETGFSPNVGMCWRNDLMAISILFGETNQVEKEISILEPYRIARTAEKI